MLNTKMVCEMYYVFFVDIRDRFAEYTRQGKLQSLTYSIWFRIQDHGKKIKRGLNMISFTFHIALICLKQ